MAKTIKKKSKADESEGNIVNDTETWLSKGGNAVFINIPVEDVEKIPVSTYENDDGEKTERITLVGSVAQIQNVLDGKKKGAKLGYFKED